MLIAPCTPMFPCAHCRLHSAGFRRSNPRDLEADPILSRLDGSVWHHSTASRPAPFQERAICRAPLAADCLLMLSFAGPWSARFLRERKPRHSVITGRRIVGLGFGNVSHLRLLIHSVQLDGTSTALLLIALQASAAAAGALGHALAASCSVVKANLKSRGMLNPLASSHLRRVNSLSAPLMSQEAEAALSLYTH